MEKIQEMVLAAKKVTWMHLAGCIKKPMKEIIIL